jgi:hypothetical protein
MFLNSIMTYSVPLKIVLLTLFSSVNSLTYWEQECLDSHNSFRNLYAYKIESSGDEEKYLPLPTVGWDEDLAAGAREYCESIVDSSVLQHSSGAMNGNFGENLARNSFTSRCSAAVNQFHNEYIYYFGILGDYLEKHPEYKEPGKVYQLQQGVHKGDPHFRTMCGKGQTKIGCARCDKNGAYTTVCRYGKPSYRKALFHLKVKKSI